MRKSGNKVRITAQLIRTADSTHLWSETYDRTLEDIFAVQDEIASAIVQALQATLLQTVGGQQKSKDLEAYALYLEGRQLAQQGDNQRGLQYLRRSLEKDPGSARAWTELANVQITQADAGSVAAPDGYGAAREAVEKAISIDPDLASAHSTLGWVQAYELDWKSAEASHRKALALEPGNATVLLQGGWTLAELGRFVEGLTLIEKSLDLDPLQVRGYDIQALVLVSLGRFADAEASYRKADELEPGEWSAVVGWTLVLQGRFEEAKKAIDSETDEAWRLLMLAYWYQGQGQEAEAAAVAQRLQAQFAGEMQAYHMAELYAHLGDDDRAFERLNRSWEKREAVMLDIKISADFQRLHDDPRYKALLKKMKLPE